MHIIHLHPDDSIAILSGDAREGDTLEGDGHTLRARENIPRYHKVAIRPLAVGETILRYGAPIGIATAPIEPGDWVHLHNLASSYLPTYTWEKRPPEDAR